MDSLIGISTRNEAFPKGPAEIRENTSRGEIRAERTKNRTSSRIVFRESGAGIHPRFAVKTHLDARPV
jgi:hypothetical protein